jgi:TonB family protein
MNGSDFDGLERPRHLWTAALSLSLRAGLVLLAVAVSQVVSTPKAPRRELRVVATEVYFSRHTTHMHTAVHRQALILEPTTATVEEGRQLPNGKVALGGFDQPSGELASSSGYRGVGSVEIGGLNGDRAGGDGFRPEGAVAPTDIFNGGGSADRLNESHARQEADEPAELLSAPVPVYSEEAKRLRVTGEVLLEVRLAASGQVRVLRILSTLLGHGLDEAAVDAANRVRCRPALKAGHQIDVVGQISVTFRLS